VNSKLLEKEIPCLIVSVSKSRKGQVRDLHHSFAEKIFADVGVKLILYVDENIDPSNLAVALWRFCNNLDPKRDSFLFEGRKGDKLIACMGLDGTTKTETLDDFHRDWPNIIVADEKTIEAVDSKWDQLGIGELIPSPSLSYRDQLYGEEAIAEV
jgi:4-hydroxy-3-polyprenylbenzoate decarboxylase